MSDIDTSGFLRVYDNIPINSRKELVVLIENRPVTWDVAYNEIINKTPLGVKIFHELIKMKFI